MAAPNPSGRLLPSCSDRLLGTPPPGTGSSDQLRGTGLEPAAAEQEPQPGRVSGVQENCFVTASSHHVFPLGSVSPEALLPHEHRYNQDNVEMLVPRAGKKRKVSAGGNVAWRCACSILARARKLLSFAEKTSQSCSLSYTL